MHQEHSSCENHYAQAVIGLSLYRDGRERQSGRHTRHLANAAEWLAGKSPDGDPRDWVFDSVREALRSHGGSVRRANAGGGFTESYLVGDEIATRQIPPAPAQAGFLEQIEASRREVASWPEWMVQERAAPAWMANHATDH